MQHRCGLPYCAHSNQKEFVKHMIRNMVLVTCVVFGLASSVVPAVPDCSSLRSSLRTAQSWLSDHTSNLRSAQRDLSDAQRRHREAQDEYRRAKTESERGYAQTRIRSAESAIQSAESRVRYSQDKVDYYNREISNVQDRMDREGCR